jgi:hypothetical protein
MVEIPDRVAAKHLIDEAREIGEWGDVHDTAHEGPHGQHEFETDWSLADMSPDNCHVEYDDGTIRVHGEIEASYSVEVRSATYNPASRAHPAEYENRNVTLWVTIERDLTEISVPVINAEIA